ncbi:MAG TPA: site-2 protease family protein [Candidatus Dormibacteraeota bacterium]|nr:site-2 protease family protein [Candidatus Dormibacteraeota bacterium]
MQITSGLKIGRILGIPIYIHTSWIFIFGLITWSLAMQYTQLHPHWSTAEHWTTGILTSLLFFASVVFHELSHSVVAQHYKIRVISITLFLFGGVARIAREPAKPSQEFNIAIAGPLASGLLAVVFLGITLFYPYEGMTGALATWLGWTNASLALFNLLPGFPLDGGRIFRAIVWGVTKDYSRATRIAGGSGQLVAYGMIAYGAWRAFHADLVIGGWLALLGFYLRNAAQESVAQVTIRASLIGLSAGDVMSQDVPIVGGHLSLEDYGSEVLRTGRRCHMVVSDNNLAGMMNVHTLNAIPRDEWAGTSVQGVMIPREKILWAGPEEPLQRLLDRLLAADINQMPVVSASEDGSAHIIGMITRDSILRVIQTRSELGPVNRAQ